MVFTSDSKIRLYIVRIIALTFLGLFLFVGASLIYHLTRATTDRPAIRYSDIIEYYHYSQSAGSEKKIVLTFDDGPDARYTQEIATILEKHNVPAAFFFIGENLLLHPTVALDIYNRGFEVGNHTFTHSKNIDSSRSRFGLELASTDYLLGNITGEVPKYYRPPYLLDVATDATINPYFDYGNESVFWPLAYGYIPVGADIDTLDWKTSRADAILSYVARDADQGGNIILLHDDQNSLDSLEKIILYLKARGYTFTTLDDFLIPPTHALLSKNMKRGDTNETTGGEVSTLQWFLYREGYLDPYALSGVYDRATEEAVTVYQSRERTDESIAIQHQVTGVVDQRTRERIASVDIGVAQVPSEIYSVPAPSIEQFALWVASGFLGIIPFFLAFALFLVIFRFAVILALTVYVKRMPQEKESLASYDGAVSVIVPAWNEERNIEATLKSIIQNTDIEKEIIVVDDGSYDSTPEIVRAIMHAHPTERIELLSVKNGGKARALNRGVAHASHDVVITMDGDSIFDSRALSSLSKHFSDTSVGAVAGKVYTTHIRTFFDHMQALEYMIGQNIEKYLLASVNAVGVIPGPIGAWRKTALIQAGGFSKDTLVEDQDMTLAVLSLGYRVLYEPTAIAYTETPQKLSEFLKQRFRWVYGSVQCFWKYKSEIFRNPFSGVSTFVLPNILLYSILLPLIYPIIDITLIWGVLNGLAGNLFYAAVLFTVVDMVYAYVGLRNEKKKIRLIAMIPLTRLFYRQLIYYIVVKSLIRALEGRGLRWHQIKKSGQAQKLFHSQLARVNPS